MGIGKQERAAEVSPELWGTAQNAPFCAVQMRGPTPGVETPGYYHASRPGHNSLQRQPLALVSHPFTLCRTSNVRGPVVSRASRGSASRSMPGVFVFWRGVNQDVPVLDRQSNQTALTPVDIGRAIGKMLAFVLAFPRLTAVPAPGDASITTPDMST